MNDLDHIVTLTDRVRNVLSLAQEEANQTTVCTEHLLLGLVRERAGVAAVVLSNLGVDLDTVRSSLRLRIEQEQRRASKERRLGMTPAAKLVIENLAYDEAILLNHRHIGTEHLLLGLMRVGEGLAASALECLDLTLEQVRAETLRVLNQGGDAREVSEAVLARRIQRPHLQSCHITNVAPDKTPLGKKAQGEGKATLLAWVEVHTGGAFTLTLFHGMADDAVTVALIANPPNGDRYTYFRGLVHGLAYTLTGVPGSVMVVYADFPAD